MNSIAKISVIATSPPLLRRYLPGGERPKMNWPDRIDQTVRTFKGDNFPRRDVDTLSRLNQTRMRVDEATPGHVRIASRRRSQTDRARFTQARNVENRQLSPRRRRRPMAD